MDLDDYFGDQKDSRQLFDLARLEIEALGSSEMRVTKSQVAFRRRKSFAWMWMPAKYLHRQAAPLVLSLSFPQRDGSPRWKEIVEPYPRRFMHHLEIYTSADIDAEVRAWLRLAWQAAG